MIAEGERLASSLNSGVPDVRELLCERLVVFDADPLTPDQLPSSFFEPAARARDRPPPLLDRAADRPLRDFKVLGIWRQGGGRGGGGVRPG